jgi:hypothetical protein
MLTDKDIDTQFDESWKVADGAKAIAFIIDEEVVHTMAAKFAMHDLLLNFTIEPDAENRTVIDLTNSVVEENNEDIGLYKLNFIKNNEVIETISTSQEILQAVLLSDPIAVVLQPEIKKLGVYPGWGYKNLDFIRPEE